MLEDRRAVEDLAAATELTVISLIEDGSGMELLRAERPRVNAEGWG